jgi:hypothetical protein
MRDAEDQVAETRRLRPHAERMQEHGFRLGEERIELAVMNQLSEMTDAAGSRDRKPEAGGDDPEQQLHIVEPPAANLRYPAHEHPPEDEKGGVVQDHEHHLHRERAAQHQRGFDVRVHECPYEHDEPNEPYESFAARHRCCPRTS